MDEQLTDLLKLCKKMNASDVHLRTGLPPAFRVAGKMRITSGEPLTTETMKRFFDGTATPTIQKILDANGDVDYSVSVPGVSRFRVNCFTEMGQMSFVFRQIPFSVPTISGLNLPKIIVETIQKKCGLYLLCGPTGSGKSTTIAALLQFINENHRLRAITLEDPIEFLFKDEKSEFLQRELRRDFTSFPDALRGALRQDPDIIMVGEMREHETIELALMAAETGHMVISTLHASTAYSSVSRILGVFPGEAREFIREQLASVMIGIVAQALIPRKNEESKRVVAREIMLVNTAIANLIRNEKHEQIPMFLEAGHEDGMISMNQSLEELVKKNLIEPSMAYPYSPDPAALLLRFESQGFV